MSDVRIFQTDDGGDIQVEGGTVEMGPGLEAAAYLSLFGGNDEDDGSKDNPLSWWGNLEEEDPAREYRSETQHLLRALPATSGNLRRVEDAANRDLAWMVNAGVASHVRATASVVGLNRVKIEIDIEATGEPARFEFTENWKAAQ